ncbi:hypothetical protein E2C01_091021 [Portunus trituberculatus]|uniref:Uncharacterized protein n=1 Tax=Portunus trituberculatus TaxID=210409 RepID=A0A5B7JMF6_PORTR|nr:hypothetical protein [Portunus trituberculatus]
MKHFVQAGRIPSPDACAGHHLKTWSATYHHTTRPPRLTGACVLWTRHQPDQRQQSHPAWPTTACAELYRDALQLPQVEACREDHHTGPLARSLHHSLPPPLFLSLRGFCEEVRRQGARGGV